MSGGGLGRCLVVGAGLIGSHVARRLADEGADVTVFSRGLNPWLDEERRRGIDIHLGEVQEGERVLEELVAASDTVVHTESSSRPPTAVRDPVWDLQNSVVPALTVMRLVLAAPHAPLLLLASSGGTVYGNPVELPTPETHPLLPRTPYAISNVAVERYADFYAAQGSLRRVVLRFSNVFGPGELGRGGQGVVGVWLRQIAAGTESALLGDPTLARDFVYVDDAATAVAAVVRGARQGVYNVGSSRATTLAEVMEIMKEVTGMPVEFEPSAPPEGHPTSYIERTQLDIRHIREDTGWVPQTSFVDGVRKTWSWVLGVTASGDAADVPRHAGDLR